MAWHATLVFDFFPESNKQSDLENLLLVAARRDDDQKYSTCALAYFAKHDLDWALWTLPGSYYVRSGQEDIEETYALLTKDWRTIRSPDFLARLHTLQSPMQGLYHLSVEADPTLEWVIFYDIPAMGSTYS